MLQHVGEHKVAVDVTLINDCEVLKWDIEQSVLDFASIQAKNYVFKGSPKFQPAPKKMASCLIGCLVLC